MAAAEEGVPPGPQPGSTPNGSESGLASELEVWRGTGIDQMKSYLDPSRVMFGVIRFTLGSGAFKRQKFCFLSINGGSVPIVKRGRQNARKEEVMKGMGGSHTDMSFSSVADVSGDAILEHMLSTISSDDGGETKLDMAAVRAQMEEQMAAVPEPEPAPEPEPEPDSEEEEPEAEPLTRQRSHTAVDLGLDFKEAFAAVRSDGKQLTPGKTNFNWLLIEPDAATPTIFNAGSGSIPEMRTFLPEDKVLFGLVRAGFGSGAFKRVKWVFVHWTGPKCPMVKRGKWNAEKSAIQELLSPYSLDLTVNTPEEAELEVVVDAIKAVIVSDGDGDSDSEAFSVAAFLAAMKEEEAAAEAAAAAKYEEEDAKRAAALAAKKAAAEAKKAAAAEAKAAAAAAAPTVVPYIAFDESAKALHAEGADHSLTAYNFLLCAFLQ